MFGRRSKSIDIVRDDAGTLPDSTTWDGGQTWTDWGDGKRKLDALEMHCQCRGLDKRAFIRDVVVPEYKAAMNRN